MIKRTVTVMMGVIILLSLLLSLCACSTKNESNNSDNNEYSDVIYSWYFYFKQDTNDILKILSSDNLSEQRLELNEKVNAVNEVVSGLLTSLETLQNDTVITDSDKEDAKENINEIASLIDESLSDLCDSKDSSVLVDLFKEELLANNKYLIELEFQLLDIIILDNMPSPNLIGLDDLKAECDYEVKDYIAINQ